MFWENFVALCNKNGTKPNPVAKELGISSGSVTFWKKGKVPHHSTLIKLANYFGVTVDYLLTEQKEKPATTDELSNGEMFNMYQSLPPELQKEAENHLRYLVAKSKGSANNE